MNKTFFASAIQIVELLASKGYIAYFAGGWVRDFLMNHPSNDIDIATSAPIEEVIQLFPKTIKVGIQFGIVIVVHNEHPFEVATFRRDLGYTDGRKPTGIAPADAKEDALRRDFTINGMFYDPLKKELYDYVGGKLDLKEGIIRAIGNPHERFREDRLRMIRAVRYATRFSFPIEPMTYQAILAHSKELFPSVAVERVYHEFEKMGKHHRLKNCFHMMYDLGLLRVIFKDLRELPLPDMEHLDDFPQEAPVIIDILELFPDYTVAQKLGLCSYFKLSNKMCDLVVFLEEVRVALKAPKNEDYAWAKLYIKDDFLMCLNVALARYPLEKRLSLLDEIQVRFSRLSSHLKRLKEGKRILKPQSLQTIGVRPGPFMGQLLEEAERYAINQDIQDEGEVLEYLKKIAVRGQDNTERPNKAST